uniref:NADH dehydrogenase subunit 2 n=1 Tax=Passalurus ambiguus TaxID=451380 RepID=A0A0P0HZG9_PASAG|nr:NADH dehydrogenase subunit 2 [Passalurus ambiguus]ALJ93251.1 NADH dehydrogenase subunit 2 [Passalurus ambiguus]
MFLFVLLVFFVVIEVINVFVWWSVFVFMDLVFIFVCKGCSFSSILNYYVLQECLGLLFLVFMSSSLQGLIVMVKMGLLPFHYWLYVVVGGLKYWMLMWFLMMQKLPFTGILMVIFVGELLFFLVFGFFIGYFQLFLVKDYKFMLMINSAESFNWILLGYIYSFFNGLVLFLYYFFLSLFLIPVFGVEDKFDFEWLVLLVYVNVPLGVSFFVKIFVVSFVFSYNLVWFFVIMFFLFVNFISLMSIMVWLIWYLMVGGYSFSKVSGYYYFIFGLLFLVVF